MNFDIGGTYYAVIGRYVDRVKILNVNMGEGLHKDIVHSVDVQIIGTTIEKRILSGFVFESELNARLYVKKLNEMYEARIARKNIDSTEDLLRYILVTHLDKPKDAKERQFIVEKSVELGHDISDQLGSVIYVDFK